MYNIKISVDVGGYLIIALYLQHAGSVYERNFLCRRIIGVDTLQKYGKGCGVTIIIVNVR